MWFLNQHKSHVNKKGIGRDDAAGCIHPAQNGGGRAEYLDHSWGTMERLAKDESVSTCGAPVHVSDWPRIGQREENSLLNSLLLVPHKAIGQG